MHQLALNIATDKLRKAEEKANALFEAVAEKQLIQPGRTELEVSQLIFELAHVQFGVKKHWHKRIVRSGENTLHPYKVNPPNRTIQDDDILFLDFGPVFEDADDKWEADFGRTLVFGEDPLKQQLKKDVETAFYEGQRFYQTNPNMPASKLYQWVCKQAEKMGWTYGNVHAGHLVGQFPHEQVLGDDMDLYIHLENPLSMTAPDPQGNPRHWILEIHFVDVDRKIGGFHEALLVNHKTG